MTATLAAKGQGWFSKVAAHKRSWSVLKTSLNYHTPALAFVTPTHSLKLAVAAFGQTYSKVTGSLADLANWAQWASYPFAQQQNTCVIAPRRCLVITGFCEHIKVVTTLTLDSTGILRTQPISSEVLKIQSFRCVKEGKRFYSVTLCVNSPHIENKSKLS